MAYEIVFQEENGYLHARVTGDNSLESVRGYFREALEACVRLGYSTLLVEENLQGRRLSLADVFYIAAEVTEQSRSILRRLAYVDVNSQHSPENTRFAETVAVNRGANVRVFETVGAARARLQQSADATTHSARNPAIGSSEPDGLASKNRPMPDSENSSI